jgi:hypothetical protein
LEPIADLILLAYVGERDIRELSTEILWKWYDEFVRSMLDITLVLMAIESYNKRCIDTFHGANITAMPEKQPFYQAMKAFFDHRETVAVSKARPWIQIDATKYPYRNFRTMPHVVVVGGGVAGLSAASALTKV